MRTSSMLRPHFDKSRPAEPAKMARMNAEIHIAPFTTMLSASMMPAFSSIEMCIRDSLQPQLHRDEHDDGGEGGRALDEVLAAVRLEALDVLVRLRLALAHASAHNVSFPLIRIA